MRMLFFLERAAAGLGVCLCVCSLFCCYKCVRFL